MPKTAILGVGHYVPEHVVTNADLATLFDTSDEWIQQRTGIKERRFIWPIKDGKFVPGEPVGGSDLAVPAVKMACERAKMEVSEIDAIIFATLSPEHVFPGGACFLQAKLGLNEKHIACLDIRNQCSGFLYGLQIADAWIKAGMYKRVALVGAEVHSSGLDFSNRGRDVAVLFGDGAACTILGPSEDESRGIFDIEVHADGKYARELWIQYPSSTGIPRLTTEMVEDEAGRIWPKMNGKQVFRWATKRMPEVSQAVLGRCGYTTKDLDLMIPHQANMRINQLVAASLYLEPEQVVHNIERYGNTTAASIPLALSEVIGEGKVKEGSLILFAAFGAGFTWGAALVRL